MKRSIVAAAILTVGLSPAAQATDPAFVPDGPLKVVVGFQPGGIGDTVARLFSDAVQKRLGQRIVVENRSGANGMIAFEAIARGKADGMTLVQCTTGPMGVSPVLPGLVLPIDMNKTSCRSRASCRRTGASRCRRTHPTPRWPTWSPTPGRNPAC